MGFDVSGLNPKINKHESEYEYYRNDTEIWKEKNEELRKKYYKEMDDYHNANPGVYFRNNVWWWRPLWAYVVEKCGDFMSDDDIGGGAYNDGHEISAEKAFKIGMKLKKLIENGDVKLREVEITNENKELAKSEDKEIRFMSSYPFSEDNVEHFANFCIESGGFAIC